MMNTSEVAIRCGEHAFTRLQKLLPQQDRLLPKIYQTEDDQYIIYWDSIHWFESSDKREAELVRAFNRAFDYLEECPFDQDGNILPGYDFESIILEADSDDYQYRSNDSKSIIWPEKKIHLPENLKELSPETGEESNTYLVTFLSDTIPCVNLATAKTKGRVKKYFLDDLNVAEKDFISVRLATEDDKHPGIPVHHIPEYPKVFSLGKECPMCGQKAYLRMTEEEENQWRKYACFGGHIQDRFPDMDVQKREFIKSGYCPDCQKALFGTEYDRSDFIIVDDIEDGEVPEDVKKFLEAAKKMNVKDVIKSETANILTTEHKVVLLSEFDLEDIFYVDDDGNIKDR